MSNAVPQHKHEWVHVTTDSRLPQGYERVGDGRIQAGDLCFLIDSQVWAVICPCRVGNLVRDYHAIARLMKNQVTIS